MLEIFSRSGFWAKWLYLPLRQASLSIKPSDLVLDIGSGHRPHFRADVLCDRTLDEDVERGFSKMVADREVVIGDITCLPFIDGAFDYIICRHLLEHIEEIEAALSELMRVGKAGYIETPSRIEEQLMGRSYHRWMVSIEDGILHFEHKTRAFVHPEISKFFLPLWISDKQWDSFVYTHFDLFRTTLEWFGEVKYRVDRSPFDDWDIMSNEPEVVALMDLLNEDVRGADAGVVQKLIQGVKEVIKRQLRPRREIDLLSILACPQCKQAFSSEFHQQGGDSLTCATCHLRYPCINGVYHLRSEFATGVD